MRALSLRVNRYYSTQWEFAAGRGGNFDFVFWHFSVPLSVIRSNMSKKVLFIDFKCENSDIKKKKIIPEFSILTLLLQFM